MIWIILLFILLLQILMVDSRMLTHKFQKSHRWIGLHWRLKNTGTYYHPEEKTLRHSKAEKYMNDLVPGGQRIELHRNSSSCWYWANALGFLSTPIQAHIALWSIVSCPALRESRQLHIAGSWSLWSRRQLMFPRYVELKHQWTILHFYDYFYIFIFHIFREYHIWLSMISIFVLCRSTRHPVIEWNHLGLERHHLWNDIDLKQISHDKFCFGRFYNIQGADYS